MTMLDRAQTALANELLRQIKDSRPDGIAAVRVVIESLREPDEAMIKAGQVILEDPGITRDDGTIHVVDGDSTAVWQAMIDAILSENKG